MNPEGAATIYVYGEGKADIGSAAASDLPKTGIVPIFVHTLCGQPSQMRVRRRAVPDLQGKGLWQKVRFAKRVARPATVAAVFVVDSEGDERLRKTKLAALQKGRDSALPNFPMAVGVAQPCIESWLLADAGAIRRGLDLAKNPNVPESPEELPAPRKDRSRSPKGALATAGGVNQDEMSARSKDAIAAAMCDMPLVRSRCPVSFAPFADEVEKHIRPLFSKPCPA